MKTFIISWLLHHANQLPEYHFYIIKNKILSMYGKHLYYDVQFIEGKKCHTCHGTGIYSKYYDNYGHVSDVNYCWNCHGNGWYKDPVWNILSKVQLGKYTFHQPYQRAYKKVDLPNETIHGYIEHVPTKYSKFSLVILYIIFDKDYAKRLLQEFKYYFRNKTWRIKARYLAYKFRNKVFTNDFITEDLPF